MRFEVVLLLSSFLLGCVAYPSLDLNLKAYSGANMHLAFQSSNYGYFSGTGSILKINLDTFSVVATAYSNADTNSNFVGFLNNGYEYYVNLPYLLKYDSKLNQVDQTTLSLPPKHYVYGATSLGDYAYFGTGNGTTGSFSIMKFDLSTSQVVSQLPVANYPRISFTYDKYVIVRYDNYILSQLDTTTFTIVKNLDLSSYNLGFVAGVGQSGQYGYLGDSIGTLLQIDLEAFSVAQTGSFALEIGGIVTDGGTTGYILPGSPVDPITIFKTDTFEVTGSFSVNDYGYGFGNGIVYGNKLFTAADNPNSIVLQVDLAKQKVIDSIALLYNASNSLQNSVFAEGYGYFVETTYIPSTIVKVDLNNWKVVDHLTVTDNFMLNPGIYYNGQLFYATSNNIAWNIGYSLIVRINTSKLAVVDSLELTDYYINSATVVGNKGYFTYQDKINIINLDTFSFVTRVNVGNYDTFGAPVVYGNYIYYGAGSDTSYKFDTRNNTVVASCTTPGFGPYTSFSSGNYLYFVSSNIWKIDIDTFSVVATLQLNTTAKCLASITIGNYGYIGCFGYPGFIAEVDLDTFTISRQICSDFAPTTFMSNANRQLIVGGNDIHGKLYELLPDFVGQCGTSTTSGGSSGGSSGLPTGAIVAIVVCGAVFVILVVILAIWLVKRRK